LSSGLRRKTGGPLGAMGERLFMKRNICIFLICLSFFSCGYKTMSDNKNTSSTFPSILKDEITLGVHHYKLYEAMSFLNEIEDYDKNLINLYKAVLLNNPDLQNLEMNAIESKNKLNLRLMKLAVDINIMNLNKAKSETTIAFLSYIIQEIQNTDIDPKKLNMIKLTEYIHDIRF